MSFPPPSSFPRKRESIKPSFPQRQKSPSFPQKRESPKPSPPE
ncbi:MAG: hypothetical protein ACR2P4_01190 [Gammaproteobacteria bacterium]